MHPPPGWQHVLPVQVGEHCHGIQLPDVQTSVDPQVVQAPPPVPQGTPGVRESPISHPPEASQQPFGHELGLQGMQVPPLPFELASQTGAAKPQAVHGLPLDPQSVPPVSVLPERQL
jgi:hypothetical protein